MAKLVLGWALLANSGFVMLAARYSNQPPLLVGFGMLLLGVMLLDVDGPNKKETADGTTAVEEV